MNESIILGVNCILIHKTQENHKGEDRGWDIENIQVIPDNGISKQVSISIKYVCSNLIEKKIHLELYLIYFSFVN